MATTTALGARPTERPGSATSLSASGPSAWNEKRMSAIGPAGVNRSKVAEKRKNYYAVVRRGAEQDWGKIFESWQEVEVEIKAHPDTVWKVFKTRLAAEGYVAKYSPAPSRDNLDLYDMQLDIDHGVIGSSSNSLGMPFHEHLARNFPSTPPLSASSLPLAPPRPHFAKSSSRRSSNGSLRLASPLRQEVIEEEPDFIPADNTALQEQRSPKASESLSAPSASSKPQRRSFFGSIKSVTRSSSRSEKRENNQACVTSPEAVAQPVTSAKRLKSDKVPLAASTSTDGAAVSVRPSTAPGTFPRTTGRRAPSVRSTSSLSVHASAPAGRTRPAAPNTAKSLWADSALVVDLSDEPQTPPQSPGKVYDEYPEVANASHTGSTPNTPKFSRSALRKTGVTLPMPSPKSPTSSRLGSPLGSPWQSPATSRIALGRSRSIMSLDMTNPSQDRRSDGMSAEGESEESSDYFDTFDHSRAHAELSGSQKAFRPNLRSMISSSSLASSLSVSSFRTAYDASTPTTETAKVPASDASSSPEGSHTLSPTLSNLSSSEGTRTYSESGASSSDCAHSQNTQRGNGCLGDAKLHAKKSGGLKRFLRIFGMTTKAGPSSATI